MSSENKCPQCSGSRGLRRMLFDDPDNPVECSNKFHDEPAPGPVLVPDEPTEEKPAEPEPPRPKFEPLLCAHCGAENAVGARLIRMGPDLPVMIVHCSNCRKIISAFQPLQMQMINIPGGRAN